MINLESKTIKQPSNKIHRIIRQIETQDDYNEKLMEKAIRIDAFIREHPGASIMDVKRNIKDISMKDFNYLMDKGKYALIVKQRTEEKKHYNIPLEEKRKFANMVQKFREEEALKAKQEERNKRSQLVIDLENKYHKKVNDIEEIR